MLDSRNVEAEGSLDSLFTATQELIDRGKIGLLELDFAKVLFGSAIYTRVADKLESFVDLDILSGLIPDELKEALPKRRREFLFGRILAAQAIAKVSKKGEFPGRENRLPVWPKGLVGSISHSKGTVVAVCAPESHVLAVGIDCEQVLGKATFSKIRKRILRSEEEQFIDTLGLPDSLVATLVFSAKESIFKAIFPIGRKYFDFQDVSVRAFNWEEGWLEFVVCKDVGPDFGRGTLGKVHFKIDEEEQEVVTLFVVDR